RVRAARPRLLDEDLERRRGGAARRARDPEGSPPRHLHGIDGRPAVRDRPPDKLHSLILSCGACKMDRTGWLTFEVWIRILERFGLEDDTLAMLLAQQGFTRDYLDSPDGGGVVATIQRVSSQACTPTVFIAACRAMQ